MLDIRLIREKPEEVQQALLKRMDEIDFDDLLSWDRDRRSLTSEIDALREKRNSTSARIGAMKQGKEDTTELQAQMKELSRKIKELEVSLEDIEGRIRDFSRGAAEHPGSRHSRRGQGV